MTIKQLYEMAKIAEKEDAPIILDYICGDCWYDYSGDISKSDVTFSDKGIIISVVNC